LYKTNFSTHIIKR